MLGGKPISQRKHPVQVNLGAKAEAAEVLQLVQRYGDEVQAAVEQQRSNAGLAEDPPSTVQTASQPDLSGCVPDESARVPDEAAPPSDDASSSSGNHGIDKVRDYFQGRLKHKAESSLQSDETRAGDEAEGSITWSEVQWHDLDALRSRAHAAAVLAHAAADVSAPLVTHIDLQVASYSCSSSCTSLSPSAICTLGHHDRPCCIMSALRSGLLAGSKCCKVTGCVCTSHADSLDVTLSDSPACACRWHVQSHVHVSHALASSRDLAALDRPCTPHVHSQHGWNSSLKCGACPGCSAGHGGSTGGAAGAAADLSSQGRPGAGHRATRER